MKKLIKYASIIAIILLVLLIGISVIPFEKWTGISSATILFYTAIAILSIYLIGLIVFVILNRKKQVIEIVEFSAPNDMTPADVGYLIDQKVDDKDISSLLIFWASKKYLEIIEMDNNTIILKKLKDSDNPMKDYEKLLFDTIFSNKNEVDVKTLPELIKPISNNISNQIIAENQKYFNSKASSISTLLTLGITAVLIFLSYFLADGGNATIFFGIVFFVISIIFSNISSKVYVQKRIKGIITYILTIILFLIFAILNLAFTINNIYLSIIILVTTLTCLLTYILCPLIEYKNKEGQKVLGQILGLKRYIEVTEKDKIESLAKTNPDAFYSVLPYAYVLNVSKNWIDKFNFVKTINKKEKKELVLAIGGLLALLAFGDAIELFGGLFGSSKKPKKK